MEALSRCCAAGSARGLGPRGRRFESCHLDQRDAGPDSFWVQRFFVFNCSAISLASCLQDESGRKPRSRAWPFLLPCGLRLQRVFILSSHSGVASQTTDVFHVRSKKTTKNSLTNGNDSAIVTPINQLETCDRDEYFSGTVSKASCGWCEHGGTGEKEWTREGKPSARF